MFFTKFTFVFIYSNGCLETILGIFNFIDSILYVQTIFFLPILIIFITILALAALPNKNYLLYLVCLEFIVAGLNLGFIFVTILNNVMCIHTYRNLSSNGVWFFPATSHLLPSTRGVCLLEMLVRCSLCSLGMVFLRCCTS